MPSWKKVITSGSDAILNDLTLSGNISSSKTSTGSFGRMEVDGKIIVPNSFNGGRIGFNGNDTTDNFILYDNFDGLDTFKLQSGNVLIQADSSFTLDCAGDIELNADGGDITFKDASTTLGGVNNSGIFSNNHITASNNISASGTITGNSIVTNAGSLDGTLFGTAFGDFFSLNKHLNAVLSITASGDISSSVTSTGSFGNLEINGGGQALLEVSGDISSSGTIISNDLQITGSGNLYGSSSYLNIVNDGTAPSELRLNCEANTHYIGIRGPVHEDASTYVLKLPKETPSDDQILKVNGSPSNGEVTLAWESDGGGGGGGVSFPTTEVISSSTDLFIGKTDAPFISGSSGNLQLSGSGTVGQLEVDHRFFDTGSSTVGSAGGAIGDTIKFGDSSGLTPGKVYYLESDGTWDDVDANFGGKTSGSIAVATNAAATNGMVLRGVVKLSHDPGGAIGAPLFISTTAGQLTSTAPGSGDFVRIVGYNLDASGLIFFNPGDTTIKVA